MAFDTEKYSDGRIIIKNRTDINGYVVLISEQHKWHWHIIWYSCFITVLREPTLILMWQAFTFAGDKTHQSWFDVMLKIKSWSYNFKCQHKMQFVFNIDNIVLLLLHKFFNYVIFISFIQFNHLHVLFLNIYFKVIHLIIMLYFQFYFIKIEIYFFVIILNIHSTISSNIKIRFSQCIDIYQ